MDRAVVVGAGILGTMHALLARRRGLEVVHVERDLEPRSATVRNFGLVWVSGRAPGAELRLALRARELWEQVGAAVPGVGFRPDGSLLVAQLAEEVAVLEEVVARPDAVDRGLALLEPGDARRRNPLLAGELRAGLWCERDAVVEPTEALPALRRHLEAQDGYTAVRGATVVEVGTGFVRTDDGRRHEGDVVVACPGAAHDGPWADLLRGAPLRRVRLQMLQTAPLGARLPTSLADGDSLRYYPAFRVPALERLPPPSDLVATHEIQLLVSQRRTGALTVGDTHDRDEPFDFALEEAPYDHLLERVASLLGRPAPPVVRRWAGVYSQVADGAPCWRHQASEGVWVVTGPGGRGMTLAPALAEETWNLV